MKKKVQRLFFSIVLQFLLHVLIPSGTNFITNMKCGVWGWEKKPRQHLLVFGNVSRMQFLAIFEFQCSNHGHSIPKLINLASLNVEFHKFGWNIQNCIFQKFSSLQFPHRCPLWSVSFEVYEEIFTDLNVRVQNAEVLKIVVWNILKINVSSRYFPGIYPNFGLFKTTMNRNLSIQFLG